MAAIAEESALPEREETHSAGSGGRTAASPDAAADRTRGSCRALLLAAGEGRRFGGGKLMAPLAGRPLVAHVLGTIETARREGSIADGVAVVAVGDTRVAEAARQAGLRAVENDDPAAGLSRSLRLGLAALLEPPPEVAVMPAGGRAALVLLGDQPEVRPEVIGALVEAWRAGRGLILRPRYVESPEEPGHPVLLDRSVWAWAEELRGDAGLGPLLRRNPQQVVMLDVAGANPDVDTPLDLAALERQWRLGDRTTRIEEPRG